MMNTQGTQVRLFTLGEHPWEATFTETPLLEQGSWLAPFLSLTPEYKPKVTSEKQHSTDKG